jgi:putative oxidoreductase
MDALINIAARILMSQIFIISGWGKLTGYAGAQQYMASQGIPGALLPLVILTELGGGLFLLAGFKTRWVALLLAAFSLLTALLVHFKPGDQMQMINFMKNLAMAGGLLLFVRAGAGSPSVDAARGRE